MQRVSVHFFASVISSLSITNLSFASCPYHRIHSSSSAQPPFSIQTFFTFSLCATTVLQHTEAFSFTLSKTAQPSSPDCVPSTACLSLQGLPSALRLRNARSPLGNNCIMLTAAGNRYRLYRELGSTALQVSLFQRTIQTKFQYGKNILLEYGGITTGRGHKCTEAL